MRKYALLLPTILLFIPSCIVTINDECDFNEDCALNEVCSLGECIPVVDTSCTRNEDCLSNEICYLGECTVVADDPCEVDQDCAANQTCNTTTGFCQDIVPCNSHNDCSGNDVCVVNRCDTVLCQNDNDCPVDGLVCNVIGVCEPDDGGGGPECTVATQDTDCPDARQDCVQGQCQQVRACTENAHCPQGQTCNPATNSCMEMPTCLRNLDCQGEGANKDLRFICIQGTCEQDPERLCGNDSHCEDGTICDVETGSPSAYECVIPGDCENPLKIQLGDSIEGSREGFEAEQQGACVVSTGSEFVMEFTAPEDGGPVCLSTKGSPADTVVYVREKGDTRPTVCDGREVSCQDDVRTDPDNADQSLNFVHQTLDTVANETYLIFVDAFPVELQPGQEFLFQIRAGQCETACIVPDHCAEESNLGCITPEDCDEPLPDGVSQEQCLAQANLCGECFTNFNCPGTNQCLDMGCFDTCVDASDCFEGDGCIDGVCAPCMISEQCEEGQTCNDQTGVCEAGDVADEGTCENPLPIVFDGQNRATIDDGDSSASANNQDHTLDGSDDTGDGSNPACVIPGGTPGNDVVYQFSPPEDGDYCITVESADFDAVVYMTADDCNVTLDSALFCYDEFLAPTPEKTTVDLLSASTYNLFVDAFDDGDSGQFTINITPGACLACTVDAHCPGQMCENNMCVDRQCEVDSAEADCGDGFTCEDFRCVAPPPPAAPTTEEIQALFSRPNADGGCVGCHGGGRAPDLRDITDQVGQMKPESALFWIQAGNAQESYVFRKIEGTHLDIEGGANSRMPQGGPFWSQDEIDQLAAWINSRPAP